MIAETVTLDPELVARGAFALFLFVCVGAFGAAAIFRSSVMRHYREGKDEGWNGGYLAGRRDERLIAGRDPGLIELPRRPLVVETRANGAQRRSDR